MPSSPAMIQWGERAFGIQAAIDSGEGVLTSRHAVVKCLLRNASDKRIVVTNAGFWPNHRITLVDNRGQTPPLSASGREAEAAFSPHGPRRKTIATELAPGQVYLSGEVALESLYELKPTTYSLSFVYHEQDMLVRSPVLQLTIEPTPPSP